MFLPPLFRNPSGIASGTASTIPDSVGQNGKSHAIQESLPTEVPNDTSHIIHHLPGKNDSIQFTSLYSVADNKSKFVRSNTIIFYRTGVSIAIQTFPPAEYQPMARRPPARPSVTVEKNTKDGGTASRFLCRTNDGCLLLPTGPSLATVLAPCDLVISRWSSKGGSS